MACGPWMLYIPKILKRQYLDNHLDNQEAETAMSLGGRVKATIFFFQIL